MWFADGQWFLGQLIEGSDLDDKEQEGTRIGDGSKFKEGCGGTVTYGSIFVVTGGYHFILDDIFKVKELQAKKWIAKWKNVKIEVLAGIEREAAGKKIVEQGKHINSLTGVELTTLFEMT